MHENKQNIENNRDILIFRAFKMEKFFDKELNISCTSEGNHRKGEMKSAVWRENDKDIKTLLGGKKKEESTQVKSKKERNYLKLMNLLNPRTWFR